MSRWSTAAWCWRRAQAYAATAVRYAAEAGAHLAGLPAPITGRLGDAATMAAFGCSLDFDAAPPARQIGWACGHASVTYLRLPGGGPVPRMWCGCVMRPVYADNATAAV